ncbi:MAG: hypothetical protein ACOYJU_00950 [Anaerovoracaceae bacterium]|jgi:hypothetical protein
MMISPDSFKELNKDKTYSELLEVRNELLAEIKSFEEDDRKSDELIEISPSPEVVYQCNLLYLAKVAELLSEKYNQEVVFSDDMKNGEYLYLIKELLRNKGITYGPEIDESIRLREEGKEFSFSEHIRAMIYSLLSNQRPWHLLTPHLTEIDTLFFDYDVDRIKATDASYFYNGVTAIKCGNRDIKKQMNTLHKNISTMERIIGDYGSMDAFVTSASAEKIVEQLSSAKSKYKLNRMGEALAWEYIRNVGIDGAKPDTHLCRFLGNARMGNCKHDIATIEEVRVQIEALTDSTGMSRKEIDYLIWAFCAEDNGEICTSRPHCNACPLRAYCNYQ